MHDWLKEILLYKVYYVHFAHKIFSGKKQTRRQILRHQKDPPEPSAQCLQQEDDKRSEASFTPQS